MKALILASTLVGATAVTLWRMRESRRPLSIPKIVMPPIGMSTGSAMFLYPPTRVPLSWAIVAMLLGWFVFSYPLIRTTKLKAEPDGIFMERSRLFLWILIGLVAVRLALRSYVEEFISPIQTGSVFYLLALGMVAHWRIDLLGKFKALQTQTGNTATA